MAERKIRICYVLNHFGIGGAEAVVLDLARGHDPERYEVEVLGALEPRSDAEPEMRRRFQEAGITTRVIHQGSFRSPLALYRFYRALKRGRYDIVHGHNRGSDYWAVRLGARAGIPHRFWTRHLVYRDMSAKQIRKYSSLADRTACVMAVSDTVREACIETERMPAEKVVTVVNGIDLERFRPRADAENEAKRKEIGHPADEKMLLFVGRFSDQKAPEAFLELIWRLRAKGQAVHGYLCGRGPLEVKLRDMAESGPGGVTILGLRSDVPQLLAACDLFVSTSRNEGLPLNVMEAMACGAAFVAPGISQIRELTAGNPVLDGQLTGAPPLDDAPSGSLLDEWTVLTARTLASPQLLEDIGGAGRARISERFSLERMVGEYERIFEKALAGRREE